MLVAEWIDTDVIGAGALGAGLIILRAGGDKTPHYCKSQAFQQTLRVEPEVSSHLRDASAEPRKQRICPFRAGLRRCEENLSRGGITPDVSYEYQCFQIVREGLRGRV